MDNSKSFTVSDSAKALRIVFMGTPAFAVASLEALIAAGCNVVAVVTAPDKPAGRGLELQQSAVKQCAFANNIPALQPIKLKDPDFINELSSYKADLQVVVAFRMLPEMVWNMPPMGTINVHGSLLPQYRGAAPINWAVIDGEKETGVTTFKLQHAIDTGNILLQESMPIAENENAGQVHDRMMLLGASLLVKTVNGIANNTLKEIPQSPSTSGDELKHAPKIFTETCVINWNESVKNIFNLVRGLSPYPAAFTQLNGKKLKIFACGAEECHHEHVPGEVITDGKTFMKFPANNGFIYIWELQLEGKKRMDVQSFLRGHRF